MKLWIQMLIACTIVDAIPIARPGAEWNSRDGTYQGIEWLDKSQPKPTLSEMQAALSTCNANLVTVATAKAQARLDVRNAALTQGQRFQALLVILDLN